MEDQSANKVEPLNISLSKLRDLISAVQTEINNLVKIKDNEEYTIIDNLIKRNIEKNKVTLDGLFLQISPVLSKTELIQFNDLSQNNLNNIINFLIALRLYIKYLILYYAIKIFILENITYPKIEENFNKKFTTNMTNFHQIDESLFKNQNSNYQEILNKINIATKSYKIIPEINEFKKIDRNSAIKINLEGGNTSIETEKKNKADMNKILRDNIVKFNDDIATDITKYTQFKTYYNTVINKLDEICNIYILYLSSLEDRNNKRNESYLVKQKQEIKEVQALLKEDNFKQFNTTVLQVYNTNQLEEFSNKIEKDKTRNKELSSLGIKLQGDNTPSGAAAIKAQQEKAAKQQGNTQGANTPGSATKGPQGANTKGPQGANTKGPQGANTPGSATKGPQGANTLGVTAITEEEKLIQDLVSIINTPNSSQIEILEKIENKIDQNPNINLEDIFKDSRLVNNIHIKNYKNYNKTNGIINTIINKMNDSKKIENKKELVNSIVNNYSGDYDIYKNFIDKKIKFELPTEKLNNMFKKYIDENLKRQITQKHEA
jgi:hypothetical protein